MQILSAITLHTGWVYNQIPYMGTCWQGKIDEFGEIVNYSPKFSFPHRHTENVFGLCTGYCLFAKFFVANSFCLYNMIHQLTLPLPNFPLCGRQLATQLLIKRNSSVPLYVHNTHGFISVIQPKTVIEFYALPNIIISGSKYALAIWL